MIQVRFSQEPLSLAVEGHAGFALKGQDIVCAAVSVLVETLALNLERLKVGQVERSSGRIEIALAASAPESALVLLAGTLYGLRILAGQYPGHIQWEGEGNGS